MMILLPVVLSADPVAESPRNASTVDRHHGALSRKVLRLNVRVNRFIENRFPRSGERRPSPGALDAIDHDYDLTGSHVRVSPHVVFTEGGGHDFGIDYSLRLRLVKLSDRLDFFADRYDTDRETLDTSFVDRSRRESEPTRTEPALAGLTYSLLHEVARQVSLSGGLRFQPEPAPRLRLRARQRIPLGPWRASLEQSVLWDLSDGFGERTQVDFERAAGSSARLRLSSSLVWSELSRGLEWGQLAACHVHLGGPRHLAFRAGALGYTHPVTVVDQYLLRLPYRQRVFRDWLFLEIEPGVDFFRDDRYRATLLTSVRLDILFGSFGLAP